MVRPEEFRRRQALARDAAGQLGLDGLVVYSRGGAFLDMYADVLYLTNHYSQQPYMADHAGIGSARSHGVVVLPVNGPTTLIVDVPWWRRDVVVADDVIENTDVTRSVGQALRQTGLLGRRVGLVGTSYMTAAAYLGLVGVAGQTTLTSNDRVIENLRIIKSPAEIKLIRRAVEVGSGAVEAITAAAVEGATEAIAVAAGYNSIVPLGGVMYDAPCSSGPMAHQFTWNRLPSCDFIRPLEKGDMFHFDCYGAYGGYLWDFGRSRVVGDAPSDAQRLILESAIEGVNHMCSEIRPGRTAGDIGRIGSEWLRESPVSHGLPEFPAMGHGVGLSWEGPWLMAGDPTELVPGMYLAVELLLGDKKTGLAMFEQNGLVTESGFEVLSQVRERWWT